MHLLVRTQERYSRGATLDANERWQWTAEIHDDTSVFGVVFGMCEERVGLAPGGDGGSSKRTHHGSFCYLSSDLSLDIVGIVDG